MIVQQSVPGSLTSKLGASTGSGPFDLIQGLPVHPLVVHAAVILIPLTALGVLLMALRPSISRAWGRLVTVLGVAACGAAFAAKESGEALAARVGAPGYGHAGLGAAMPNFAASMLVVPPLLWAFDRRAAKQGPGSVRGLRIGLGLVAAAIAVANLVWVYRVGESGARSVWADEVSG
jgi:hypothetical protein